MKYLMLVACVVLFNSVNAADTKKSRLVSVNMNRVISKPNGQKLGEIRSSSEGQRAFKTNGEFVGRYDESRDKTYLPNGHEVGRGNWLSSLITEVN